MKLDEFDYPLPSSLIAQVPLPERDQSRLMVLHRESHLIEHKKVLDLVAYLRKGDALVLNDSRVIPARLLRASPRKGEKGARGEVLLLEEMATNLWECLVKPAKKFRPGSQIFFRGHDLVGEVVADTPFQSKIVRFRCEGDLRRLLSTIGSVPLPPYIRRKKSLPVDWERYQTVFASKEGSVAAPTAGFHFTHRLLNRIREKGVLVNSVTLHVGLGTFQPVRTQQIEQHRMHAESFSIQKEPPQWKDRPVHLSGIQIQSTGRGSAPDEFPPPQIHSSDANLRFCGARFCSACLPGSGSDAVQVLQLWRRHAHCLGDTDAGLSRKDPRLEKMRFLDRINRIHRITSILLSCQKRRAALTSMKEHNRGECPSRRSSQRNVMV